MRVRGDLSRERRRAVARWVLARTHGRFQLERLVMFNKKFAPRWEPRHLVAPSTFSLPGALMAIGRAYSPNGLVGALRRND